MANETGGGEQTTVGNLYCSLLETFVQDIKHHLTLFSGFNIFLSIAAVLGNVMILDALRKESFLRPSSKLFFRCLATTDICVGVFTEPLAIYYWMSVANERWNNCRSVVASVFMIGNTLTLVSLLTVTAISVDRLLSLLLGLRYKHIVTMERTYMAIAAFWIMSIAGAAMSLLNYLVYSWYVYTVITLCLVTAIFTYTKIFHTLRHHQNQVHNTLHQIPPLTLARDRKAVSSALWLQLAMGVCYLPHVIVGIVGQVLLNPSEPASSWLFLAKVCTVTLVYLNSSLNPILYSWKIRSVRNTVKARVKQVLCC